MCLNSLNKILLISLCSLLLLCKISSSEVILPFQGEVNADNINIRSDSRVGSEPICKLNKGASVEVVLELYDWYKIRLPKLVPAFIKKHLVMPLDEKTAKVEGDRVNIRLGPSESSPIIGMANKDEVVTILEARGDWYKIEPTNNSFGWIHKRFVNKFKPTIKEKAKLAEKNEEEIKKEEDITVEGIVRPKTMKHIATHKLITQDKKLYLLKGEPKILNSLNYRKVRLTGKIPQPSNQENPLIKVEKIEELD